MKFTKKKLAFVLLVAALLIGLIYLFTKKKSTTAGKPTFPWSSDDEAAYNTMISRIKANDPDKNLSWIMPLFEESYNSGIPAFHNLNGNNTKAGALLSVMEAVNPNVNGNFTGNQSGGNKQIFPDSLMTALWHDNDNFQYKYL